MVLDSPPCCTSSGGLPLRSEGATSKAQCGGSIFKALAGFEPATPSRSNRLSYQAEFFGRGGWIRTTGKRNQNPMPYRLATPPLHSKGISPLWRSDSPR